MCDSIRIVTVALEGWSSGALKWEQVSILKQLMSVTSINTNTHTHTNLTNTDILSRKAAEHSLVHHCGGSPEKIICPTVLPQVDGGGVALCHRLARRCSCMQRILCMIAPTSCTMQQRSIHNNNNNNNCFKHQGFWDANPRLPDANAVVICSTK